LQYAISSSESVAARLGKVNLASPLQIEASTIVIAARKAESDSSCQTLNLLYITLMKQQLLNIKSPSDIKSFEVVDIYEDDNAQCADVIINGIPIEFLWYDEVGFVSYWNESKKAFDALLEAIDYSVRNFE